MRRSWENAPLFRKPPVTLDFEDDGDSFRVRRERQLGKALTPKAGIELFIKTIVWCFTGAFVLLCTVFVACVLLGVR